MVNREESDKEIPTRLAKNIKTDLAPEEAKREVLEAELTAEDREVKKELDDERTKIQAQKAVLSDELETAYHNLRKYENGWITDCVKPNEQKHFRDMIRMKDEPINKIRHLFKANKLTEEERDNQVQKIMDDPTYLPENRRLLKAPQKRVLDKFYMEMHAYCLRILPTDKRYALRMEFEGNPADPTDKGLLGRQLKTIKDIIKKEMRLGIQDPEI